MNPNGLMMGKSAATTTGTKMPLHIVINVYEFIIIIINCNQSLNNLNIFQENSQTYFVKKSVQKLFAQNGIPKKGLR